MVDEPPLMFHTSSTMVGTKPVKFGTTPGMSCTHHIVVSRVRSKVGTNAIMVGATPIVYDTIILFHWWAQAKLRCVQTQ